jgi:hypothetical protein
MQNRAVLLSRSLGLCVPAVVIAFIIWPFPIVAEAQTHPAQKTARAKVLSGGVLSGWDGVFVVVTEPDSIATFTCSDPEIVVSKKRVGCIAQPDNEGPQTVGSNGTLDSWHVRVRGNADFTCRLPMVNLASKEIECPPQPAQERVDELQAELQRTKDELQALKAEKQTLPKPGPEIWTITIMGPPPGAFSCLAPIVDPGKEILTCAEVVRLF